MVCVCVCVCVCDNDVYKMGCTWCVTVGCSWCVWEFNGVDGSGDVHGVHI